MSGAYFKNLGGRYRVTADNVELEALDGSIQFIPSPASNTLTVSRFLHAGKTVLLDALTGVTITLPAATGSGDTYKFLSTVIPTSNNDVIQVTTTDTMVGYVYCIDSDTSDNLEGFVASGTSDTITMDKDTKGGNAIGEYWEIIDIADALWFVKGATVGTNNLATPFSAAVS